jgi:hypothetical protein
LEYKVLERIKDVADQHRIAILMLHHEAKAQTLDELYRASGTAAMVGVPDTVWLLSRQRGEQGAKLMVTGRSGVREQRIDLTFDPHFGTWQVAELPRTAAAWSPAPN